MHTQSEQAVEAGVDFVGDGGEVGGVVFEVEAGFVDGQNFALVLGDEFFVAFVEALEVIEAHGLLVVAAAFLDLGDQMRDIAFEIDQQIREFHRLHHHIEKVHVGIEIAFGEVALGVVVGHEDIDALKDGAILDNHLFALGNVHHVLETLRQEIDLQVERSAGDVLIVILQIGVVGDGFKFRRPAVMLGQHPRESGFSAADIPGDSNVHRACVYR